MWQLVKGKEKVNIKSESSKEDEELMKEILYITPVIEAIWMLDNLRLWKRKSKR